MGTEEGVTIVGIIIGVLVAGAIVIRIFTVIGRKSAQGRKETPRLPGGGNEELAAAIAAVFPKQTGYKITAVAIAVAAAAAAHNAYEKVFPGQASFEIAAAAAAAQNFHEKNRGRV